ncbi:MAG: hypothetical protein WCF77_05020 [Minisyncoccia bacterium]|jgi:hypothetical protein
MNKKISVSILIFVLLSLPLLSRAQSADSTSLTITPPFFELNVNPGDVWSSSIKVVNTNASDLQVHAVTMGFVASDDQGHGNFIPMSQLADDGEALANWITVSGAPVTVPRGGSADVPFTINVPADASPGGHYAGILIGTGAPAPQPGMSQVGVSSFISALIFVRVSGDVTESANIQEFSADRSYYQTPDVRFSVRVQNTGDVHVRPVGMIEIYNAFGKERGEIPINQTGNLGYILPSSSREFDVSWQGVPNLLDIGPYTAVLSLAYGENGTKSVTRTIEFWILPIGQIFEVLFAVLAAVLLFIFTIKRVVRRMLTNEMSKYGGVPVASSPRPPKERKWHFGPQKKESLPPREPDGVIDLRNPHDKQ